MLERQLMLTVADILEMPEVRRGSPEVISGHDGLGREVRWAHVVDVAGVSDVLKGGEFVLNNGITIGLDPETQRGFIRQLAEEGAAAVAVELDLLYKEGIPVALTEEARITGLPLIALRSPIRFIDVTEAVYSRLVDQQFSALRSREAINRRLTTMAAGGATTQAMLVEVGRVVEGPVILEDSSHGMIEWSAGGVDPGVVLSTHQRLARSGGRDEEGVVTAPIRFGDLVVGQLIALSLDEPLSHDAEAVIAHAAEILSLQLASRRRMDEVAAHSRGAFLNELMAERFSELEAKQRADALGFRRRSPMLVAAAAAWRPNVGRFRRPDEDVLAASVRSGIERSTMDALVGPRPQALLIVVDPGQNRTERDLRDQIADAVHTGLADHGLDESHIALAIGPTCDKWLGLGEGLERCASRAATAAIETPAKWHDGSRLGVLDVLFALKESPILAAFVSDRLGALEQEKPARREESLLTLQTYFKHAGHKTQAARELNLERQSIYHRLDRLSKLLDVDWNSGEDLLALHLALVSYELSRPGSF